jgi:hypothetical protein
MMIYPVLQAFKRNGRRAAAIASVLDIPVNKMTAALPDRMA